MWIGYLVEVLGFVVAAVFVKETLPVAAASDPSSPSQSEPLTGADDTDSSTTDSTKKPQTVKEHVEHYLEKAKEAGTWMLRNPKIVLLLICFWLYMMGEQAEMLLMIQYASKRLGWSFGKVRYCLFGYHLSSVSPHLLILTPSTSPALPPHMPRPSILPRFLPSILPKGTYSHLLFFLYTFPLPLSSLTPNGPLLKKTNIL